MFQHSPFLLVVTWNRTYIFVLCFVTGLFFHQDSYFHLHALLRAAGNFSLLRRKNYTLFAYNLIIRCLRYCEF